MLRALPDFGSYHHCLPYQQSLRCKPRVCLPYYPRYNKHPGVIRDPKGPREDAGFLSAVNPGVRMAARIYTYCQKYHPKTKVMVSGIRKATGAVHPFPAERHDDAHSCTVHVYSYPLLTFGLAVCQASSNARPVFVSMHSFCISDALALAGLDYLVVGPKVLAALAETPTLQAGPSEHQPNVSHNTFRYQPLCL